MTVAVKRSRRLTRFATFLVAGSLAMAACTAPVEVGEQPVRPYEAKRAAVSADPLLEYATARLATMPLREKVASLFMLHLAGTDGAALGAFADRWNIGGLILMGDNIPEPESVLGRITPRLSTEAGLPVLVAIDQEGGVVRRLYTDRWHSAGELRYLPPEEAKSAFANRAAMLAGLGVSVNFGIVADVTPDSSSFIFDRSMGATGADAAPRIREAVAGELGSVYSTLKHFPGHGVAPGDSHWSIPSTSIGYDQWLEQHAPPFQAGIDAGAEFVMFGHLQFDSIDPQPASLSPAWYEILRDDLGFDGVAITDDMLMLERSGRDDLLDTSENAIRALAAGVDMLLYVGTIDVGQVMADVTAAVETGRISEQRIDEAALRVLTMRRELSGQVGAFVHCFAECRTMLR